MPNDVYKMVQPFRLCRRNSAETWHKSKLQLFPLVEPVEVETMDLLGPLPKTNDENQFLIVIIERYSKLKRATLTEKSTRTELLTIFLYYLVMPCRIQWNFLIYTGPHFDGELSPTHMLPPQTKKLTTNANQSETKGQAEWYNRIIVARRWHDLAAHKHDCDLYR